MTSSTFAACATLAPALTRGVSPVLPGFLRARRTCSSVKGESAGAAGVRRARAVSPLQRACAVAFGSPSVRRANGGAEASFALLKANAAAPTRRVGVPVFEIDRRGADAAERLPRIWVSEPCFTGKDGALSGRAFVGVYPNGPDPHGAKALEFANRYIGEARACSSLEHVRRTACFRAAEILLLHAAQRRCVEAYELLASIYESDACEGAYWSGELELRAAHGAEASLDQRVVEWRAKAAARGFAPSCCALASRFARLDAPAGDQLRAYRLYRRVCDGAALGVRSYSREDVGVAMLGLARCAELGIGRAQSFADALECYRCAHRLLSESLDEGMWSLKRDALEAKRGANRMMQEIDGRY